MLSLVSGRYPTSTERGGGDRRSGVRLQPQDRRHLAPGWPGPARGRHRAEPPEPARRVRPGGAGTGHRTDRRSRCCSTRPGSAPARSARTSRPRRRWHASNPLNPETIVLTLATLGMLLIALVAVGGFTVLAQRRLRSIGMLGALGATDKNIRLVVRANGVVVGVVGTLARSGVGPRGLARLPTARRGELPSPDRCLRAALGGGRHRHGPGRRGHLLRRLAAGAVDHQGPRRDRPVGAARPPEAGAPLGGSRRRLPRDRVPLVVALGQQRRQRWRARRSSSDSWPSSWP